MIPDDRIKALAEMLMRGPGSSSHLDAETRASAAEGIIRRACEEAVAEAMFAVELAEAYHAADVSAVAQMEGATVNAEEIRGNHRRLAAALEAWRAVRGRPQAMNDALQGVTSAAVAAEREACAKVADDHREDTDCGGGDDCWRRLAMQIRARGGR